MNLPTSSSITYPLQENLAMVDRWVGKYARCLWNTIAR